jgi:hypothetical protein
MLPFVVPFKTEDKRLRILLILADLQKVAARERKVQSGNDDCGGMYRGLAAISGHMIYMLTARKSPLKA